MKKLRITPMSLLIALGMTSAAANVCAADDGVDQARRGNPVSTANASRDGVDLDALRYELSGNVSKVFENFNFDFFDKIGGIEKIVQPDLTCDDLIGQWRLVAYSSSRAANR